jgi:YrbI family 3-deoxy-D-manno-octulosonate 8-phosphate phosphatase
VKLLVLDFDGVLTDNRVWVSEDGTEAVACHRGDGMGISLLRKAGLETFVLSTETNPVVSARCRKLGIDCIQGLEEKADTLARVVRERGLRLDQVAYIGNDVNDLSCLEAVGFPVVVADAHPHVIPAASLVLSREGGKGAVREFCDLLLKDLAHGEGRDDV